jgi:hypothetical protein
MPHWVVAETCKCFLYLRARDSGVDKHFAIITGQHSYVSTRTFQNANVAAKLMDVDLRGSSCLADRDNWTFHYFELRISKSSRRIVLFI